MPMPESSLVGEEVTLRRASVEDAEACGQICFDAFSAINAAHNFPCDFPSPEVAAGLLKMMFSSPAFYGVVAEAGGRIIGSNVVTEHGAIAGVGPITVDPAVQNRGAGRKLMEASMDRARERGAAGIRLVQAAFHNRSLSLYASLGFDVREPLSCMQGKALGWTAPGFAVRRAAKGDLAECNALSMRVHGFDRGGDLAAAIEQGKATVCERGGQITGYSTELRVLRAHDGGDEPRSAGADRRRGSLRRARVSAAFAKY